MAIKKLITAVAAALGLAAALPASAIVVGGIDFGASGASAHIEFADLAETYVNAVGQTLQGYGFINKINGDTTYCADGTSNCGLYYYFHNYTVQSFDALTGKVTFTGGVVDIYYSGTSAINFFDQDSTANVASIQGLTPWVQLTGHSFASPGFAVPSQTLNGLGTLTGETLSQGGFGLLDSNAGFGIAAVTSYLNGNSIGDSLGGHADIAVTTSSNNDFLNPIDAAGPLADSCKTGEPQPGDWCLQGTLNTRGATNIPEPATLALLGVGLLGLGFTQRKRRS